jgi:hypothetical protein
MILNVKWKERGQEGIYTDLVTEVGERCLATICKRVPIDYSANKLLYKETKYRVYILDCFQQDIEFKSLKVTKKWVEQMIGVVKC